MKAMQMHLHLPSAHGLAVADETAITWGSLHRCERLIWRGIVEWHRECAVAYESAHQPWAIASRLLAAATQQEK